MIACFFNNVFVSRNKLKHFAEMKAMERVFEPGRRDAKNAIAGDGDCDFDALNFKGRWRKNVFKNSACLLFERRSLVLELACGRGDYTVALAERFPKQNFIGVDVKGSRMWHGCRAMIDRNLKNAAFLRIRIEDLLDYFDDGEVDEIWITFPDPHPSKENKRLTSPRFLEMYKKVLKPHGLLHLKHDDADFFEYSRRMVSQCGFEVIRVVEDIYGKQVLVDQGLITSIQTTYEKRHLAKGKKIHYGCLRLLEK